MTLSAKGAQQPPPLFGPCLLWPRSPISATAELLHIDLLSLLCIKMFSLAYMVVRGIAHWSRVAYITSKTLSYNILLTNTTCTLSWTESGL